MPIFEYQCNECGKQFEAIVYGDNQPACPECQGTKLQRQLSVFAVAGSSKGSGAEFASGGACGSCGDPRGEGACSMGDDFD
ncbi:MAG: zinc ribbon domain-containing protein [Acidobacteria bacterium]|nr:zinc ribbon domain-containing protein [Acidobacteriota bacterium]